eukprot:s3491_g2.t1
MPARPYRPVIRHRLMSEEVPLSSRGPVRKGSSANLRWLHFPKAGTSFAATVWSYAHLCLPQWPSCQRLPAFQHSEYQDMVQACTSLGEKATACYARSPGIAGCTARMLTGRDCAEASSKLNDAGGSAAPSACTMVNCHSGGSHQDLYDESLLNAFREQVDKNLCGRTRALREASGAACWRRFGLQCAEAAIQGAARELQRASAAVIETHMFLRIGRPRIWHLQGSRHRLRGVPRQTARIPGAVSPASGFRI